MKENVLTQRIIGSAMKLHTQLGPGLLESAYQECLAYELSLTGHIVEKEKPLPLTYKEVTLESGYRIDLLIDH